MREGREGGSERKRESKRGEEGIERESQKERDKEWKGERGREGSDLSVELILVPSLHREVMCTIHIMVYLLCSLSFVITTTLAVSEREALLSA